MEEGAVQRRTVTGACGALDRTPGLRAPPGLFRGTPGLLEALSGLLDSCCRGGRAARPPTRRAAPAEKCAHRDVVWIAHAVFVLKRR
eukprot:CAMPEP_0179853660 /NCGR_PEP_ID=MMETSP0982-20121206/9479_1 /TAXON_ID=483367 /ORGANISM="non described non described, Strain CCMP 2436" /LENGTH=86 /DNA_ID=CAMNT_0021739415 /DNA_START=179 /DNA_END=439 /DNA_ORIENTATION=+